MKISKLDWLIYRLFRWRWNPIFKTNKPMAQGFISEFNKAMGETDEVRGS